MRGRHLALLAMASWACGPSPLQPTGEQDETSFAEASEDGSENGETGSLPQCPADALLDAVDLSCSPLGLSVSVDPLYEGAPPMCGPAFFAVDLRDLDSDGVEDVIFSGADGIHLRLTAPGAPVEVLIPAPPDVSLFVVHGADLDGDGHVDLVRRPGLVHYVANALIDGPLYVNWGDGTGSFGEWTRFDFPEPNMTATPHTARRPDGREVLVVSEVLSGGGQARFNEIWDFEDRSVSRYVVEGNVVRALGLADFDGDGLVDFASLDNLAPNGFAVTFRLGLEDGSLGEPSSFQPTHLWPSLSMAADLNGDGKSGLYVAEDPLFDDQFSGSLRYYNYADGAFDVPWGSLSLPVKNLGLVDADDDGDLDLYVTFVESDDGQSFSPTAQIFLDPHEGSESLGWSLGEFFLGAFAAAGPRLVNAYSAQEFRFSAGCGG